MKVVILCGGLGTRIRGVSDDIPKPMIPVGNLPILWHIMQHYAAFGHKDFILCLGYKGNVIRDFFLNHEAHTKDFTICLGKSSTITYHNRDTMLNWNVTLAETGENTMTGARIAKIKKYIGSDPTFMLTYGDGLGNIDLHALLRFHQAHQKIMTITGVKPPGRFGELKINAQQMITGFNEKPQATAGCISGGFFVCQREIFNYLNDDENLMFEEAPIKTLVALRQAAAYQHDGFWQPMDTYRDYLYLNTLIKKGEMPWDVMMVSDTRAKEFY